MDSSIGKQFYNYLGAYILVALSGCLGNVVDGIIVGNLINEDGVSAIVLSKPVVQLIFTLHLLINAGGGMLVAYAVGKGDKALARTYFTRALGLSVGLGVLLAVVCGAVLPLQTSRLLCSNADLLPLARAYIQVLLLGAPVYILMWGLSTMVGADGEPKLVSIAVIVDNAVNLGMDIVCIKWLGWGIAGSSVATVIGHLVGIAILLLHWRKTIERRLTLTLRIPEGLTRGGVVSKTLSQGAPLAIASVCLTLLLYSANKIVLSTLGRAGIFAFALCMNLLQIYNLFLSGTCQTLQSLGAVQVGKGDAAGLRMVIRKGLGFITVAMIVTCAVVWIWPQGIVRLFGSSNPEFISESDRALRIFALSFIPFCYIYVLMIIYKLKGRHRLSLFISFALSLTVIPVLWIVSRTAPNLLWYSYLIAYGIEGLLIAVLHTVKS